jgi:hypothetical protein
MYLSSSQLRTSPTFTYYPANNHSQGLTGGTLTGVLHTLGQLNDSNVILKCVRIVVSVVEAPSRCDTQRAGFRDIQAVGSQLNIVSAPPEKCQC